MTTLKYGNFSVELENLSVASLAYLAQYGFGKSLQDSVAGLKKEVGEDEAKFQKDLGVTLTGTELADEVLARKMESRFDDIIAGTVGTRTSSPRLSGIDKIMRDVAKEAIKAKTMAKKVKMPEGEALAAIVAKYIANHEEAVKEEATRRMEAQATLAEGMDDDLAA